MAVFANNGGRGTFFQQAYVGRNSDRLQRDKQTVFYIWGAGVYHIMCNIQDTYSLVHVLLKTQMREFDSDWCLSFNSLTITLRENNQFKSLIMSMYSKISYLARGWALQCVYI